MKFNHRKFLCKRVDRDYAKKSYGFSNSSYKQERTVKIGRTDKAQYDTLLNKIILFKQLYSDNFQI
jgi:hypothetical protein